jgi:hypothetical protein
MGKSFNTGTLVNGLSTDANGNVAIGIASPTTRLTIGRVDSTNEGGQIDLCRASDNTNAWGIDVFGNTTTPSLRFIDNVASAARMVITGAGNVGIGTSSPYLRFDVRGGAIGQTTTDFATGSTGTVVYMRTGATTGNTTFGLIQVGNTGDNIGGNLVLNQFGGNVGIGTTSPFNFGAGHKTLDVRGDGTTSIGALFVGNSDRTAVLGFYINPNAAGTVGTSSNHALQLVTNDVERMRITSGGFIGIGTSSPATRLEVTSSGSSWISGNFAGLTSTDKVVIGAYPGVGAAVGGHNNALSAWAPLSFNFGGGAVYAGSQRIDNNSDARVKENIVNVENALETVLQLQGRKFNMIDEDNILRYGFIAQEVQPVLSDFVKESNREYKDKNTHIEKLLTLETSGASWAALLVEAIKELKAEIEILKNK